ncbi:MAG: hypothetical protein HRU11_08275 [Parvularculaceae bacterium]|nr:hypothetical protein [Parvularculaceae bacterium]
MSDHPKIRPEERSMWETPEMLKRLWIIVPATCVLFGLMNIVLAVMHKTHPHFTIDKFPVFYGVVGFLSFSFIVLAGQHLRKILMREEGYYDGEEAMLPRPGEDPRVYADDRDLEEDGE